MSWRLSSFPSLGRTNFTAPIRSNDSTGKSSGARIAVGVFPDVDSILRLVGTLLRQQNRQWQNEKYYLDPGAIREIVAGA